MKRIVLIILIILISIILCSCDTLLPYGRNYRIFAQADTNWITEDETMSIHVNDDGSATLIVKSDGEEYELLLLGLYRRIDGYDVYSVQEDGSYLSEEWHAFYHKKWFSIKVDRSKFFEKGTKIKFFKVEE